MDEENVNSVVIDLDKTTILQNLENKFSRLQLSPKHNNIKYSSCSTLSADKDRKLEPEENVIMNISKQEINIEKWEEGQEIEVKVIEPTSIHLAEPSISYKMTDVGKYSYWSSVGLLTNKRRDPLYLGPDNEDLKKVFESANNEEVIRLTSPTYIELENLPEENIRVEYPTKAVKKTLESENNEQVLKLTSPILIESDDWSGENPSLECETNTMDYVQYDLMDEISIGEENNIESLNSAEPVEQLQLKEKKKSFFGRLIGEIFGCFFNKKQTVR